MLAGSAYIDELYEGNPLKCYEIFSMTRPLLDHFVNKLNWHGYLRDG